MAITYSLLPITTNPRDKKAKRLVYARAQSLETLTTRDIAAHISSHNSPFSEGVIIGLLQDAQRCILETLMAGKRVDLDTLGAFYTTLSSRGAKKTEEFTKDNIERINLRWKPSKRMTKAIQYAELKEVPNRREQRKAVKEMLEIVDTEVKKSKERRRALEEQNGDIPPTV